MAKNDVLVIGAGLAGLTTAWQASIRGKKAKVIAKGWGAMHWHAGCVDVLGYWPVGSGTAVINPAQTLAQLSSANPRHPYALLGLKRLHQAVESLKQLCAAAGYPLQGSLEKNWLLPSAVGTFRPTCLAPATMTAGDLSDPAPMLLVGFKQLADFFPNLAADNLTYQGIPARHVMLDLPTLAQRNFTTAVILARLMEQSHFRAEVVQNLRPHLKEAARVGFPGVLGLQAATDVHQDLQKQLGRPVFEMPGLPPSITGMRLHNILKSAIEANGGRVFDGLEAVRGDLTADQVTAVYTKSAARDHAHRYQTYVLATGGLLGGGITTNHTGTVCEVIFSLPLHTPENHQAWFHRDFMDSRGHPIYRSGVTVNTDFQPTNSNGHVLYQNLYAAGTTLAHCEVIRERSFEGVALGTGYAVGQML